MLSTHQISTNMGKLTDIYNIVWRLPEYSVFLFYCVCKPFRFFSAHFLQVKFWNLGRVIGRQIDTDLEFSKPVWNEFNETSGLRISHGSLNKEFSYTGDEKEETKYKSKKHMLSRSIAQIGS